MNDIETRSHLVSRLRAIIEWVSDIDHSKAVELDLVVHQLETLAAERSSATDEIQDDGDIEWCAIPDCVRPVSHHPEGLHLTEGGREFTVARPPLTLITDR